MRVSSSEVYTLLFYSAIVNKVLRHCHSWLARQYTSKRRSDFAISRGFDLRKLCNAKFRENKKNAIYLNLQSLKSLFKQLNSKISKSIIGRSKFAGM